MPAQDPQRSSGSPEEPSPLQPSPRHPPARPWRTEGLPKSPGPAPKRRWIAMAAWFVGYLVLFGILTLQDRLSGPQPVPYTEFKSQVGNRNVAGVFARGNSIEGELKKA